MKRDEMKRSALVSIIAVIQLVALLQIAVGYYGPSYWRGSYSDLRGNIARGGEVATIQFDYAVISASKWVIQWGVGLGATTLVMSTIAALLLRKEKK